MLSLYSIGAIINLLLWIVLRTIAYRKLDYHAYTTTYWEVTLMGGVGLVLSSWLGLTGLIVFSLTNKYIDKKENKQGKNK